MVPSDTEESTAKRLSDHLRQHLKPSDLINRYALVIVWGLVVLIFSVVGETS